MKKLSYIFLFLSVFYLLTDCARQGMPSGGDKDTTPPQVLSAFPPSGTVNFNRDRIIIKFDEFITLDNPLQKIVISPPLQKPPEIKPSGYADKKIQIRFKEKLRPNTTYTIYFNDAIKDYHEGNILKDYTYVFSTGPHLDSLTLKGTVKPSYDFDLPEKIIAGLYPADSYTDSLLFVAKPYYLARVRKDGSFIFENLAAGDYILVAFSDENGSLNYQPGKEQIAFLNEKIKIPRDKEVHLILFPEKMPLKVKDLKQKTMHKWALELSRPSRELDVDVKGKTVKHYTRGTHADVWIKQTKKGDTLRFVITENKDTVYQTLSVVQKEKKDTLLFRFNSPKLYPLDTLFLYPTIPLVKIDSSRIRITPQTTFNVGLQSNGSVYFVIPYDEEKRTYRILIKPGALHDFLGGTHSDTLTHQVEYEMSRKTGNLKLVLDTIPGQSPLIVQLYESTQKRVVRQIESRARTYLFRYLPPGRYKIRIIWDLNQNGVWDPGDLKARRQPEPVFHYPKILEVRPNWDLEEKINITLD